MRHGPPSFFERIGATARHHGAEGFSRVFGRRQDAVTTAELGVEAETWAAEWLQTEHHFDIIARNARYLCGEVDLVARADGTLVFVEVRARSRRDFGHPLESIDFRKKRRICAAAREFMADHGTMGCTGCRFDVVGIWWGPPHEAVLVRDAFPAR